VNALFSDVPYGVRVTGASAILNSSGFVYRQQQQNQTQILFNVIK